MIATGSLRATTIISTIVVSYKVYFTIIAPFLTVTVIFTSKANLFILSATKDNSFYRKVVGAKIKNGVKSLKPSNKILDNLIISNQYLTSFCATKVLNYL